MLEASKAQSADLTPQSPNYFQCGILEDDGAVHAVAVKTHIDASIVATAVSFDDNAVSVLGMSHSCSDVIRILICNLAVFIIDYTRTAWCSRLWRSHLNRIAINNVLIVFLDGRRHRRRARTVRASAITAGTATRAIRIAAVRASG